MDIVVFFSVIGLLRGDVFYIHSHETKLFEDTPETGEIVGTSDFWLACISVNMILGTDLRKSSKKEKVELRRWLG